MSTVTYVPETYELEGDDAAETMARVERWELMKRSALRFRYADGFSFARAVAFQVVLTLFPTVIVAVAVAVAIGDVGFQNALQEIVNTVAPGPASDIIGEAFEQAEENARTNIPAIVAGGLAGFVAAVTTMSQVQRGSSRIYGIDSDRPTVQRYLRASWLTLSVGVLMAVGLLLTAFGSSIGGQLEDSVATIWKWARWPVGVVLAAVGIALLYKFAPNRRQPSVSWLVSGGIMATVVWVILTILLTLYLNGSSSFGDTYGPLAGFIGVMLWAQFTGIALLYGVAFTAQLEAERVGLHDPVKDHDPSAQLGMETYLDG